MDVRFKHDADIECLTAKKISPVDIHRRMQAVYGINVLMSAQLDIGYGILSKKEWRKPVCVTKKGQEGQWLQHTSLIKNMLKKSLEKLIKTTNVMQHATFAFIMPVVSLYMFRVLFAPIMSV